MNTVNIIGRLTRDPEPDETKGGTPVCRMRLAVPRRRKDGKDQGAVFVTVVAYGGQADAVAAFMTKGRQVAVSGRLEFREWTAPDGSARSTHEVVADHVDFIGSPGNDTAAGLDDDNE